MKLIKDFIQKILINIYSRKKSKFETINPSQLKKKINNALILLPEEKELILETKFLISVFEKLLQQKSFLIESHIYSSLNLNGNQSFIIYSREQKNIIDLPRKNLIKTLQFKDFDTIVDCNLQDSNFHYWITKSINAKYKIGLFRKNSTIFNNLVVKIKKIESVRSVYKNLILVLKL